jgi:hypothetical protein
MIRFLDDIFRSTFSRVDSAGGFARLKNARIEVVIMRFFIVAGMIIILPVL